MTWILLGSIAMVLALALAAAWHRRADLRRQADALAERRDAAQRPATAPPLQVPVIDLERCLGCGTCVKACPEDGVLQLVHGQAAVVQASACVGHAHCVAECPVAPSRWPLAIWPDVATCPFSTTTSRHRRCPACSWSGKSPPGH